MSAYEELVAAPEPQRRVREGLLAVQEVLAYHRVAGTSQDGTVTATVNGSGDLLEVVVLNRALRGSHPEQVGPAIVAAVQAARAEAARYARDQYQLVLDPDARPTVAAVTSVVASGDVPSTPVPVPTATRQAAPEDGDDLFQGFGS